LASPRISADCGVGLLKSDVLLDEVVVGATFYLLSEASISRLRNSIRALRGRQNNRVCPAHLLHRRLFLGSRRMADAVAVLIEN
jgi:hypothetical protein